MLTIITPSYNRGNYLTSCYESLKKQNKIVFQWLIIDDGSCDNTKEVIDFFREQKNDFYIDYYWKKNGGKHTALNYAHSYIKGEYVLILDSDDYLVPKAVEKILFYINRLKKDDRIGVISFRKGDLLGNLIGIDEQKKEFVGDYISYRVNKNIHGDQCEIIRTDILKKYPFPVYYREKFLGEDFLWISVAKEYNTLYVNEIIYICEYLPGGLTKSGRRMRINNPLGGMMHGRLYFTEEFRLKYRIKGMMLFICYALFAKKGLVGIFCELEYKKLFLAVLPLGVLLYFYWMWRYDK